MNLCMARCAERHTIPHVIAATVLNLDDVVPVIPAVVVPAREAFLGNQAVLVSMCPNGQVIPVRRPDNRELGVRLQQ